MYGGHGDSTLISLFFLITPMLKPLYVSITAKVLSYNTKRCKCLCPATEVLLHIHESSFEPEGCLSYTF